MVADYFKHIHPDDKPTVEKTVEFFKNRDFEVYLTGSAAKKDNYSDIDLIMCPKEDLPDEELDKMIDTLLHKLGVTEINDIDKDYSEKGEEILKYAAYKITMCHPIRIELDIIYVSKTLQEEREALWGSDEIMLYGIKF